jgi:ABC-type multidrug transport system fused ATPase/permease subunit
MMNLVMGIITLFMILFINSKISLKNLFRKTRPINSLYGVNQSFFHRKESWILLLFVSLSIGFAGFMFQLSLRPSLGLIIIGILCIPLILHYQTQANNHAVSFHQITTFLQHFLAHFKIHQQTYHALHDVSQIMDEQYQRYIKDSITTINEDSSHHPLTFLYDICPHFNVLNIMSWIQHVEQHGMDQSYEILDMLENDIDDWIEDATIYIKNLHSIKNKILILVGLSLIIALFNQHMLSSFMDLSNNEVYQFSIFVFMSLLYLTIIKAFELLDTSWILRSECLWKE